MRRRDDWSWFPFLILGVALINEHPGPATVFLIIAFFLWMD